MNELPSGWVETTLGELGNYWNGRGFKSSEWSDRGRPIIRIQNLTGSRQTQNFFEGRVDPRQVVVDGDLLVSWAATLGVFVWRGPEAVLNQHIFKVESFIDRRFHRYVIESVLDDLRRESHGSGMVHITKGKFDATPIAIPPLGEQRRIVAAIEEQFSRLDAAEVSLGRALRKLGFLRARVLEQVTSGAGEWLTVEDVAEVQGGIQKQPKRRPVQNRFPFLRVANVLRGRLDLSEVHEIELFGDELRRLRLQPGDLLVVEGNGSLDQIGRSAMWRGEIENCVHQNHLIRVRPAPGVDPTYLNLFWNAPKTAGRIASIASSTSGLYTLSTAKVRSIPVRVPPLDEQRRIVAEVERQLSILDATKAAIDRALGRSKALRRAILERAFTGRLVPQDPSDEPASVLLERIRAERAATVPPRRAPSRRRATMAAQPSLPGIVGEPGEN